jgi:hyperosmotically inducible periplasmic protein
MKSYHIAMTSVLTSLLCISIPLFASEMDDRIEFSAKQSYVFKTFLKGDDITITSEDGVVTLTGTVSENSSKSLAWETVANLPGVVSVNNKLEEKSEAPAEDTDAWLITNVKSTLLFHRNVNAIETEVLAKDGTVTLRGKADSVAQKDLATEYAWDVQGVKDVQNEMTTDAITPGPKTMDEKMDAVSESIDDVSITALVKTTLLYHRSTSALRTTVNTQDGVVYLGGKARNAAEEDLATKLVSDVHGVKRVVNNMSIEGIGSKIN